MANDCKSVVILGESRTFKRSLLRILDGFEVDSAANPSASLDECDVAIVHSLGELDDDLVERAVAIGPTLVIADQQHLIRAVDAGCRGFLSSHSSMTEIRDAAIVIADGGAVVPPDLLGTLLRHVVERRRADSGVSALVSELTAREQDVFDLASQGAGREEIAEKLFISPATVRTHLQRIYKKLGVHSQSELMSLVMEERLPG